MRGSVLAVGTVVKTGKGGERTCVLLDEGDDSCEGCFASAELPREAPYRDALVQEFLDVSAEVLHVDVVVWKEKVVCQLIVLLGEELVHILLSEFVLAERANLRGDPW